MIFYALYDLRNKNISNRINNQSSNFFLNMSANKELLQIRTILFIERLNILNLDAIGKNRWDREYS